MIERNPVGTRIADLRDRLSSLRGVFDFDDKVGCFKEVNREMGSPDIRNVLERAQAGQQRGAMRPININSFRIDNPIPTYAALAAGIVQSRRGSS